MKRIHAIVLIFALLSLGGSVYAEPFEFKAQSVILIEATTGEVLYEKTNFVWFSGVDNGFVIVAFGMW